MGERGEENKKQGKDSMPQMEPPYRWSDFLEAIQQYSRYILPERIVFISMFSIFGKEKEGEKLKEKILIKK